MTVQKPEEKLGSFYLGAEYDLATSTRQDDAPIIYDSRDLVTHAVVVGMTGSGKTGLCVGLLEDAALDKVPALIIDPKGDMTNLLLQFPNLRPSDFAPWINQGDAERKGKTVEEFAESTATQWSEGLADWSIAPERIAQTNDAVEYTIFTPGSDAGIPVNILGSLSAPQLDWNQEGEAIRERISGTVAALMGLAGIKEDPVRSREAILLASIFEHCWKQMQDLSLESLISYIQTPPFSQVGVFDVETFYPSKDRFSLAMSFNNLVAAPTFRSWLSGEPLDIQSLMYNAEGKPRHSIFYIAHLSDSERMFFVTLLLENLVTWMRRQSGTTSLRGLLYFDEIFGYFPPSAEPASKRPLLTLMKQARAFGLGVVLVTQNPVDLDYKGLTNAGTWLIGKLQAERDKARVMEGLKGALAEAGAEDKTDYDTLIPQLGSRVFLMHNVHADKPRIFNTRWAQSYLRGPLTKTQVRDLMVDRKGAVDSSSGFAVGGPDQVGISGTAPSSGVATDQAATAFASTAATAAAPAAAATPVETAPAAPAVPEGLNATPPIVGKVELVYLPVAVDSSSAVAALNQGSLVQVTPKRTYLVYRPNVLGVSVVNYVDKKWDVEDREERILLAQAPTALSRIDWEDAEVLPIKTRDLRRQPESSGEFGPYFEPFPDTINESKELTEIRDDLKDWLYRYARYTVRANEELGVAQKPGESDESFATRAQRAADERYEVEAEKARAGFEKEKESLAKKLTKAQADLVESQAKVSAKRMDQFTSLGESVLNFFFGRRSSTIVSSAMRKQNQAAAAAAAVEKDKQEIATLTAQQAELESESAAKLAEIAEKWKQVAARVDSIEVSPRRTDIAVDLLAVAWTPEWAIEYEDGGITRTRRMPAYEGAAEE